MANVHGFNDFNDRDNDNNQPNRRPLENPWQGQEMDYNNQNVNNNDFGQGNAGVIRAGGEDIHVSELRPYHYLCLCCCPCCIGNPCSPNRKKMYIEAIKTFCFTITIVQVIMFIIELSIGGLSTDEKASFLAPRETSMVKLGAKVTYYIQHFQLWRFITPVFLHGGLLHILFNLYFQISVAMTFEQQWNWKKFIPIYFISAFGATLLSCLASPDSISVGASGALMGILGAWLCDILSHWNSLQENTRKMQLFQCVLFIIIIMIFGLFSTTIDGWAHLGGLIVGFLVACCFFNKDSHKPFVKKFGFYFGLITTFVYFTVGIILLWTVIHPSPYSG